MSPSFNCQDPLANCQCRNRRREVERQILGLAFQGFGAIPRLQICDHLQEAKAVLRFRGSRPKGMLSPNGGPGGQPVRASAKVEEVKKKEEEKQKKEEEGDWAGGGFGEEGGCGSHKGHH